MSFVISKCGKRKDDPEERVVSSENNNEKGKPLLQRILDKAGDKVEAAATDVNNAVEELKHGASELAEDLQTLAKKFLLPQSSLEQNPGNNIHVPHPDKLVGGMVGLGMNVQKDERGHVVHKVTPEGLAAKSTLRENDVIVSVSGEDVTSWEFEKLQEFFGSLKEVDLKIVVERQEEDESGNLVCRKVTISIKFLFEGDKVFVDLDVKVRISRWEWTMESDPVYIFQNLAGQSTTYLMLKNNCFCMSTAYDLEPARFKFYQYTPVKHEPKAIINLNNSSPLDHGKPSRIGEHSDELRGSLYILKDNRIFFTLRQLNTFKYTFRLASDFEYYLTSDEEGNLTTTRFPNIEAVGPRGLFDIVPTSKVDTASSSDRPNRNPKARENHKANAFDKQK